MFFREEKRKLVCKKEQIITFFGKGIFYFPVPSEGSTSLVPKLCKLFSLLDQPREQCQLPKEGVFL